MSKRFILPAAALVLLAAAAPAYSQSIYFGAFGGYSAQTPEFQNVQFTTDTTFVYGLRAGLRLLTFSVELMYFKASHNIIVGGGTLIDWNGKIDDYSYIGVNAKLYFPLLFLNPYITAGYGYYAVDIQSIDKANDGGLNVGAGLELKLGSKVGLTAEGRWHNVSVSLVTNLIPISLSVGDFTLTGGINFYF